jgi:hypothetical protein
MSSADRKIGDTTLQNIEINLVAFGANSKR